jgi:hypothetical protein
MGLSHAESDIASDRIVHRLLATQYVPLPEPSISIAIVWRDEARNGPGISYRTQTGKDGTSGARQRSSLRNVTSLWDFRAEMGRLSRS